MPIPPLAGIKIVEAGSYVTVPFAGLALAQLGAEVVKVEQPGGDALRRYGLTHRGVSAWYTSVNHGKRGVVLDLKDDRDRETMFGLLADADVFMHNWRPGATAALGLSAGELIRRYPKLIQVTVSGYGGSGPKGARPVFDNLIQVASGLAAYEARGPRPAVARSMLADKTTAMFVAQAVLAALVGRAATGEGTRIDLSMLDAMAYFNFPDVCQDRTFLDDEAPPSLPKGRTAVVETSDGHLVVAPVSGRQIAACARAVGHPEWTARLKATTSPTELTDVLFDLLETVTPSRTSKEWEEIFSAADVPAAAVLGVDAHLSDAQTLHNELYSVSDGTPGAVRRIRYPALWEQQPLPDVPVCAPPPADNCPKE